jgi:hypothetical protein
MQQSHYDKVSSRRAEINRAILDGLREQEEGPEISPEPILSPPAPSAPPAKPYPNERRQRGPRAIQHDQRSLRERLFPYEAISPRGRASAIFSRMAERAGAPPGAQDTLRRGPGLAETINNHARRLPS